MSKKRIHVEKLPNGREVHFEDWDGKPGYAIFRFCPYCGAEELQTRRDWPQCTCQSCGLEFDDDSTEMTHSKFKRHHNN